MQKHRRARLGSFFNVVLYRVPLRVLSRVWPYCSPWSSYGLPTQTLNCFVDVKYCMLPRELWSQWIQEPLLRLTVTLCWWMGKRQNHKHKRAQTECPDLLEKGWLDMVWDCLHVLPLHLSQPTFSEQAAHRRSPLRFFMWNYLWGKKEPRVTSPHIIYSS
jgi:hypothetical protein